MRSEVSGGPRDVIRYAGGGWGSDVRSQLGVVRAVLGTAALGWAALTFYLLTSPDPPGAGVVVGASWLPQWVIPTVGHLGLFGVLAALLTALAFAARLRVRYLIASTVAVVVLNAAYGAALELYQSTLPSRYASWTDGAVNFLGAVGGVAAVVLLMRLTRRTTKAPPPVEYESASS